MIFYFGIFLIVTGLFALAFIKYKVSKKETSVYPQDSVTGKVRVILLAMGLGAVLVIKHMIGSYFKLT